MTSKEALSQILCHATLDYNNFEPLEYIDAKRHYAEAINKVEKDLEVLEILKRIDWSVYKGCDSMWAIYNCYDSSIEWKYFIDTSRSMRITKEEFEKIKEWLEERKQQL